MQTETMKTMIRNTLATPPDWIISYLVAKPHVRGRYRSHWKNARLYKMRLMWFWHINSAYEHEIHVQIYFLHFIDKSPSQVCLLRTSASGVPDWVSNTTFSGFFGLFSLSWMGSQLFSMIGNVLVSSLCKRGCYGYPRCRKPKIHPFVSEALKAWQNSDNSVLLWKRCHVAWGLSVAYGKGDAIIGRTILNSLACKRSHVSFADCTLANWDSSFLRY